MSAVVSSSTSRRWRRRRCRSAWPPARCARGRRGAGGRRGCCRPGTAPPRRRRASGRRRAIRGGAASRSTRPAYCRRAAGPTTGVRTHRHGRQTTAAKGSMGNVTQTPTRPAEAGSSRTGARRRPLRTQPGGAPLGPPAGGGVHRRGPAGPADRRRPELAGLSAVAAAVVLADPGHHRGPRRSPALRPPGHAPHPGLRRDLLRQGRVLVPGQRLRAGWPDKANDAFIAGNPGCAAGHPRIRGPPAGRASG